MYFHEIASEMKTCLKSIRYGRDFVIELIDDVLREPMNEEERRMKKNDEYNPLASGLSVSMLDKIFIGAKFISKARARLICSRYDGQNFADQIDNLYDADKEHLLLFLRNRGLTVEKNELGSAVQDILNQIFHGLSKGEHNVPIKLTLHDPKPSIKNLAADRVYCENGKIYIDGDEIELPIKLSDAQIYDFEIGYLSALLEAYAEVLSLDKVTIDDISTLPLKYQNNFYQQRKAYLSAESIQRSIREVYDDGENQFDILKADAFDGIKITYFDDHDSGYRRLLEVLKKISNIQLTKSKLMLIKNLIGHLERHGIVHILVNDKTIRSWVDPYEK